MPIPSVADFIDAVRQRQLLETAQFDEMGRLQADFAAPRALAGELIRRGWLTAFQVNQLMQGRGQGLLLGSYVLLERLGEGGMGEVFKARNWKLGQIVALKLIRKERIANPDAVRRFHREIRAAAQLDHTHIVRAFDADEVCGTHLLVMEYIQGTDLAKLVKKDGPLAVDRACDYARQAALGLQHACERGMVHRDIKPPNLLVTPGGVVKILDMGLARLDRRADDEASATMTREGTVMGTLDYISPEQAMDSHDVDIRADLYSLGCTLYFLLTGKVPFPGGEALKKLLRHRLDEPVPVEQLRQDVPPAVAAVVRKLMAKRPDDRYQTPAEAATALVRAAGGGSSATPADRTIVEKRPAGEGASPFSSLSLGEMTEVAAAPPRRRRTAAYPRWLWPGLAAGAVTLLVGGAGLVWLLSHVAPPPTTSPSHEEKRPEVVFIPRPKLPAAVNAAWLKEVAAKPAEDQVKAVMRKLQDLNPAFDGKETHKVEDGVVTELGFLTDNVTDISPVRALPGLKTLNCGGSGGGTGRLSDLSPLKGMPLTSLNCGLTKISDLSPLKGMPLTVFTCYGDPVYDLSPLKGMPLTGLHCAGTPVSDLTPLKDMKLTWLEIDGTQVSDLSPLKGMPLTSLQCCGTQVSDLSPLKGMPLTTLICHVGTPVSDFSPLKDLPLKVLYCDFQPKRDAEILRSIKTLEKINEQPAAEVLK